VSELQSALIGGFIGGSLGVFGTLVTSYWGPRRLEEWRERRHEELHYGPRKDLLMRMLSEPEPPIRSLRRLSLVTGTTNEECRRLLIDLRARGVLMRGGEEGWALIERYDFSRDPEIPDAVD